MNNNDDLIDLMKSATKKPEGPKNQEWKDKEKPTLNEPVIAIGVLFFSFMVIGSLFYGASQCEGTYVVGLFQMECIE